MENVTSLQAMPPSWDSLHLTTGRCTSTEAGILLGTGQCSAEEPPELQNLVFWDDYVQLLHLLNLVLSLFFLARV